MAMNYKPSLGERLYGVLAFAALLLAAPLAAAVILFWGLA
jgi:hypothetical protein